MSLARASALLARAVDLACGARCAGCGCRGVPTPCAACGDELKALVQPPGAAWPDAGAAGRLVRHAKFGHWRRGGAVLARLAHGRIPDGDWDLVTWVPADRARRARRGGHVPELVARTIARQLGIPCRRLLDRRRGPPQQGLDREARRRNVAHAWVPARAAASGGLAGRRVLLVDDLRTTGATLESAALVLERSGATVGTFALVQHDERPSGVPRLRKNPARCEEFPLTTVRFPADSVVHDRRKDALRVREPRPP